MPTLIRFIPNSGGGVDPTLDRLIDEDAIFIGRSTNNTIQLFNAEIRAHHVVIHTAGVGFTVEAMESASLTVGGRQSRTALLETPDDIVTIGGYKLRLGQPVEMASKVLLIESGGAQEISETALAARYERAFDVRFPLMGPWSWAIGLLILIAGFVLPLVFGAEGTSNLAVLPHHRMVEPISVWNVGVMSSAHAAFGSDCKSCHQSPFQRVTAAACLSCHATIGQHADPHASPDADISGKRCESCHHEHKGLKQVIDADQQFCGSCHSNIKSVAPRTILANATDFDSSHPQFSPSLVVDAALRTRMPHLLTDNVIDQSGLKFPHAKHLKADGVKGPDGLVKLDCASCHKLDADGAYMKPVSFAENCQSCHQLQFEPKHPEWRLPHGQPTLVSTAVLGFYSQAVLRGERFDRQRDELFAKPGAAPLAPPEMPAAAARSQAAAALASSIARSTCGGCHVTEPPAAGADPLSWTVKPVFVPTIYMTRAKFNHTKHNTVGCTACHAAAETNTAELDTGVLKLLPGIETCRTCHAGESGGTQRIASTCTMCHNFHNDALPLHAKAMQTASIIQGRMMAFAWQGGIPR